MARMKIEILGAGNMTSSGSTVLRAFQNNHTPLLDLFIREVLQNSLDAANKNAKNVNVDFYHGTFKRKIFADEFEMLPSFMRGICVGDDAHFLAVRDSQTTGLTGPINKDDVNDGNFGNLIKLVFDLGKPQDNAGSGGSWGYGKTLYYRLSRIGFVLYYSRIKKAPNSYESRLIACMVEDETSNKALLPGLGDASPSGIAWWGKKIKENKVVPETDEKFITKIINLFGIKPYEDDETGTTIIIPFPLREDKLTKSSIDEVCNPYWTNSINDTLKVLIQRWYFPRLENKKYGWGPYLKISINGHPLKKKEMFIPFYAFQGLYRSIFSGEDIYYDDFPSTFENFINSNKSILEFEEITITNNRKTYTIGNLAYMKVDARLLGMLPPDNNYSPYIYINQKSSDSEKNSPIFAFCRKPGMIVSYVTDGDWLRGVPPSDKNEYVFCLFVLNSDLRTKEGLSIEEYFRQSEKADHNSWQDHDGQKFIEKTKSKVAKKLKEAFSAPVEEIKQEDSGLGGWLGSILLPPQGFGAGSSSYTKGAKSGGDDSGKTGGTIVSVHRNLSVTLIEDSTQYRSKQISLVYKLNAKSKCRKVSAELKISSETGDIKLEEWKSIMGIGVPFEIESVQMLVQRVNNVSTKKVYEIDGDNDNISDESFSMLLDYLDSGIVNRALIDFKHEDVKDIQLTITLSVYSKDKVPTITFSAE